MDASTIEVHESVIRHAKGIIKLREQRGAEAATVVAAADRAIVGPFVGMLESSTSQLKATIDTWESWLRVERVRARSG